MITEVQRWIIGTSFGSTVYTKAICSHQKTSNVTKSILIHLEDLPLSSYLPRTPALAFQVLEEREEQEKKEWI